MRTTGTLVVRKDSGISFTEMICAKLNLIQFYSPVKTFIATYSLWFRLLLVV